MRTVNYQKNAFVDKLYYVCMECEEALEGAMGIYRHLVLVRFSLIVQVWRL